MASAYRMQLNSFRAPERPLPLRYSAAFRFYNESIDEHPHVGQMTWADAREIMDL